MNPKLLLRRACLLALLVVLAVLAGSSAQAVNLSHNETYVFEFNGTGNETFTCEAVNKTAVCGETSFEVDLQPGETRVVNREQCVVTAACADAPNSTDNDLCVIDKELVPGEEYENTNGACNIAISVSDNDEDDESVQEDTVVDVVPYRIAKTTEGFRITLDNESYNINGQGETYVAEGELRLPRSADSCDFSEEQDKQDLLSVCEQFTPYLVNDWIRPTLESCKNSAASHVEDVKQCDEEKDKLREHLSQCRSDLSSCETGREAETGALQDQLTKCEVRADRAEQEASGRSVMMWLLGIYSVIVTVICTTFLFRYVIGGGDA